MKRFIIVMSMISVTPVWGVQELLLLMNEITKDNDFIGGKNAATVAQWGDSSIDWINKAQQRHTALCTTLYALAEKAQIKLRQPSLTHALDTKENLEKLKSFEKNIRTLMTQLNQTSYGLRNIKYQVELKETIAQHQTEQEKSMQQISEQLSAFIGLTPLVRRRADA